eukprot:482312-Amphidinium_carterae.1
MKPTTLTAIESFVHATHVDALETNFVPLCSWLYLFSVLQTQCSQWKLHGRHGTHPYTSNVIDKASACTAGASMIKAGTKHTITPAACPIATRSETNTHTLSCYKCRFRKLKLQTTKQNN